jgi:hypothetical protein
MVYDDGVSDIKDLKTLNFIVSNKGKPYNGDLQPVALGMNGWIFKELGDEKSKYAKVNHWEIKHYISSFIGKECGIDDSQKITLAGKNLAAFDIPMLHSYNALETIKVHHRVIDVGAVYFPKFGYVPNLSEINALTGRQAVSHDALDDALDVVHAIRHIMKENK